MNIVINKDIETEYRDEIMQGFSLREAGTLVVAFGSMVGTGAVLYVVWGVPIEQGVYAGVPVAFVAVVAGFKKFQGLTLMKYLREIIYERRTKVLVNETEKPPSMKPFSLKKKWNVGIGRSMIRHKRAAIAVAAGLAVVAVAIGAVAFIAPMGDGDGKASDAVAVDGTEDTGNVGETSRGGTEDTRNTGETSSDGTKATGILAGAEDNGTESDGYLVATEYSGMDGLYTYEEQNKTEGDSQTDKMEGTDTEQGTVAADETFVVDGVDDFSALSGVTDEISELVGQFADDLGTGAAFCEIFYAGILDANNPDQITFFAVLDDVEGTIIGILYDMNYGEISVTESAYTENEIYAEVWNNASVSGESDESYADEGD